MSLLWYRMLIANVPHKGFTSVPNQWGENLGLSAVRRLVWQYRVSSAETCIWFESEIILENCKIKKYKIQPSVIRRTILLKLSFGGDEGCILGRLHISRWTSIILSLNQDIAVGVWGAILSEATVNSSFNRSEDDWGYHIWLMILFTNHRLWPFVPPILTLFFRLARSLIGRPSPYSLY